MKIHTSNGRRFRGLVMSFSSWPSIRRRWASPGAYADVSGDVCVVRCRRGLLMWFFFGFLMDLIDGDGEEGGYGVSKGNVGNANGFCSRRAGRVN